MPTNCLSPKGPKPLVAWVKVLWISQPTIPNHLLRWTFRIFELRPPVVPIIIAPPLVWDLNSTGVTSSGLAGLLHTLASNYIPGQLLVCFYGAARN